MNLKTEDIKMLPENKTVVFYTPLKEDDEVIVRTGTIGEGSCLFHSVLHACSKEYQAKNKKGRMDFVKKLRGSMAKKIDKDEWTTLGNGMISRVPFQENINSILSGLYNTKWFSDNDSIMSHSVKKVINKILEDNDSKKKIYRIISELVPLEDGFYKNILPNTVKQCEDVSIIHFINIIKRETIKYLANNKAISDAPDTKLKLIKDAIYNMLDVIINEAEHSAFKAYKNGLKNISEEVDQQLIGLISDRFDRDIYFIDTVSRMPYKDDFSSKRNIKNRKSIIILWVGHNHFEIIGKLLPGNRIQREFNFNEPIIKKIHTLLCNPEKVSKKYPSLVSYIPKNHKHLVLESSDENSYSE
jgi:hypothetical protein